MLPEYPKASLGGIPEEILLNITTCLRDDRDALAKLCRTDRRCRRITEEVLYASIDGDWDHQKACAISRWPALAKNLRTCTYHFGGTNEQEPYIGILENAHVRVLENTHNIRYLEQTERYVIFKMPADAYTQTGPDHINKTLTLFNKAVDQPFRPHNRFTQLTDVRVSDKNVLGQCPPLETLSSLFRLPVLAYLSLEGFHQYNPFTKWTIPVSTSLVKELHLTGNFIHISAVTQIVASVRTLQHFEYRHNPFQFGQSSTDISKLPVWPKQSWKLPGKALRQHRDCLETVAVAYAPDPKTYLSDGNLGNLGSFADFPKLKRLTVNVEAFLDIKTDEKDHSQYLPEQLESFMVRVQSIDMETILSCLSTTDALARSTCDRCVHIRLLFERLHKSHVQESPRLSEALRLLYDSEFAEYISIIGCNFTLRDVVRPGFLEESDMGEWDEVSGEEGGEEEDEDDDIDERDNSERNHSEEEGEDVE